MSKGTAPKGAISLTKIDIRNGIPGTPYMRVAVVLPIVRIDEIQEAVLGEYPQGQYQPVPLPCSLVVKVNGEQFYVAEKPSLIRDLINSVA